MGFVASPTPGSSLPGLLFCRGLSFIFLWSHFSGVWKGEGNEDRAIYLHARVGYETYAGSYLEVSLKEESRGAWQRDGSAFACNTCMARIAQSLDTSSLINPTFPHRGDRERV